MRAKAIRLTGVSVVILASLLVNCDPFRVDVLTPDKRLKLNSLETSHYLLPNSSAIIDLKSLLTFTATQMSIKIVDNPNRGKLVAIRDHLLQYVPNETFKDGSDFIRMNILEQGKVVLSLTLTMTVKEHLSDFPCSLYAIEDLICRKAGAGETIYLLANDRICDTAKEALKVTLHVAPEHGTATLKGDTITYVPAPAYEGPDFMIYKVSGKNSHGVLVESLGLISVPPPFGIRFEATAQNMVEGTSVVVPIKLDRTLACTDTIRITVNGTALYGEHYTTEPPAVKGIIKLPMAKGAASAEVKVLGPENDNFEGSKLAQFRLLPSGEAFLPDTVTVLPLTISDNEGPSLVNFATNVGGISENSATGLFLPIQLSSPAKGTGTITVSITSGNAVYGTHYTTVPEAVGGTINLNVIPNQTFVPLEVRPVDNQLYGGNLVLSFQVSNSGGVINLGSLLVYTLTIVDNETPQSVSFKITGWETECYYYDCVLVPVSKGTLDESQAAGKEIELAFSEPVSGSGTVTISWQNEGANCNPTGYGETFITNPAPSSSGTLVLPVSPGETNLHFTVLPVDNNLFIDSHIITFQISSVSGAIVKGEMLTHQLTIVDNETPSIADFAVSNASTGEDDADGLLIEIPFSTPTQGAGTLLIRPYGSYGSKYITDPPPVGQYITLDVAPGQSSVNFRVIPVDNATCGNSNMSFEIAGCGFVKVENSPWTGNPKLDFTIVDDEAAQAVFAVQQGTVNENSANGIVINLNFSKTLASTGYIFVRPSNYEVRVTPMEPVQVIWDYYNEYFFYRLSVPAGSQSASFTLIPVNNQVKTGDYVVQYTLNGSDCVTASPNTLYTLTVVDDEN